jgi:transposase
VWLTDKDGRRLGDRSFEHSGEGLANMATWLLKTSGSDDPTVIQVAIEVPHGPIVETLLERGFTVWALNPKQMDRFRDRFSVAGAKDDSRDALVMASALRTDTHCFRKLTLSDPLIVELREWSRIRDDLTAERTALVNRVRQQLWRYFPAFLQLDADLQTGWVLELWRAVPSPDRAKRVRLASVEAILKRHRIRRLDAKQVLEILRQPPFRLAPGTAKAAQAHVDTLVDRIRLINRQIADADRRLDALTDKLSDAQEAEPGQNKQRDVMVLASLPGIGRTNLATLLAEACDALQRRDYHALRALMGVAPVTRQSGRSRIVLRRFACNPRLANAAYHWANTARQHDPVNAAKYADLRRRGHSHGRALRSVTDRLLNVACSMLRAGTTFNPALSSQNAP